MHIKVRTCTESYSKGQERNGTLDALHLLRRTANHPKTEHENEYGGCGDGDANSAEVPHRSDPILKNDDDIRVRPTAKSARVTIAVVKEVGELETRQRDQPHRVEEGE